MPSPSRPTDCSCTRRSTGVCGHDRYATAANLAGAWNEDVPTATPVGVASGTAFADSLTGGAYMALMNGPLLLTATSSADPPRSRRSWRHG
ncbi:cell wall-binding repeat-containing protein [Catenulispora sp. GP43]|uniref:cell wall-binding repeat-containing protein n=1 Tax=Catenulispora sp. GP43 TaxID=3156263 RepID=UPI003516E4EE